MVNITNTTSTITVPNYHLAFEDNMLAMNFIRL